MKKDNTSKLYIYDKDSEIVHLSSAVGLNEQVSHMESEMTGYKLFTPMYQGLYLVAANKSLVSIIINTDDANGNNNESLLGMCKEIYRMCIYVPLKDAGEKYIKFINKDGFPFFVGMNTETTLQYFNAGGGEPVTKYMLTGSRIIKTDVLYTEAVSEINKFIISGKDINLSIKSTELSVGDKVINTNGTIGIVYKNVKNETQHYPFIVKYNKKFQRTVTKDGREYPNEKITWKKINK